MDMLTVLAVLILIVLVARFVFIFNLIQKNTVKPEDGNSLLLIQQQMQAIAGELRGMTKEVTSVKEIGRQTQGFAQQLQNLQDILKNPKQRGILGEYYLETVLKNVLPPGMYQMQYPFKNG